MGSLFCALLGRAEFLGDLPEAFPLLRLSSFDSHVRAFFLGRSRDLGRNANCAGWGEKKSGGQALKGGGEQGRAAMSLPTGSKQLLRKDSIPRDPFLKQPLLAPFQPLILSFLWPAPFSSAPQVTSKCPSCPCLPLPR